MNSVRTKAVESETDGTPAVNPAAKVVKGGAASGKTAAKVVKPRVKEKSSSSAAKPVPPVAEMSKAGMEEKQPKVAEKKPKLVRDSFTFPESEYKKIGLLKQRALAAGREIKKSELLRAGLDVLFLLPDQEFLKVLDSLTKLKSGRPSKK